MPTLNRMLGKGTKSITDAEELKLSSIDRFRRFEGFHGVFRMPIPAAIAMAESSDDVARVIEFANQNSDQRSSAHRPLCH